MQFLQRLDLTTTSHTDHYPVADHWHTAKAITAALANTGIEYRSLTLNSEALEQPIESAQDWLNLYRDIGDVLVQHQSEQLFVIPCQKSEQRIAALEEQQYPCKMINAVLSGEVLFAFRTPTAIYECLCQAGDLIVLPENQPFWMDLGENPDAVLIRALPAEVVAKAKRTGESYPDKCSRLSED
jgi:cupin superfamily acireductone dioxygenase involved in methionine salvage